MDAYVLQLSGSVTITAGGKETRIELTETQLRSLAYHAGQAVMALDLRQKREREMNAALEWANAGPNV